MAATVLPPAPQSQASAAQGRWQFSASRCGKNRHNGVAPGGVRGSAINVLFNG
jgi:hypothetical protein